MFDEKTEMLIERFFDNTLSAIERSDFDRLVSSDPELKRRIDDDAMVRSFFRNASQAVFKSTFVADVVRDVHEEMALIKLLSTQKAQFFDVGLRRRVIDAIESERSQAGHLFTRELSEFLRQLFPKVAAPVALAASLAIVANVNAAVAGAPIIEALLGLPSEDAAEFSFLSAG